MKKISKSIANLFKKAWNDTKELGWLGGSLAILVAIIIFYLPTIITFILYVLTNNGWYLGVSIAYVVWWFSPAFSPALITFSFILLFIVKIFRIVQKRDNNFKKE